MKKLLLFLAVFASLSAQDELLEVKIYRSIAQECTQKENPKIYFHGDFEELQKVDIDNRVSDCFGADFIITDTKEALPYGCRNMLIFTNNYRLFKNSKQIIGAFFWQKGRPNIIFDAERLRARNMILDPSYQKYIE